MKTITACASAILLAIPMAAQAYTASNRLAVSDIGNATFEVVARGGTGSKAYWCAAGEYAQSIGAPSNGRVYVVTGPGPSATSAGRTAVQFTTNAQAAGVTPVSPQASLTVSVPGDNLSVAAAQQYCVQGLRRS